LANVKENKGITLPSPNFFTTKLESMNLYQKNYKRIVGVVSHDKDNMNKIIDIIQQKNKL